MLKQLKPKKKNSSGYDILDARISPLEKLEPKIVFFETVIRRMYDGMMNMIGLSDCVVFGTGDFGERCTKELNRRGIQIKYYIDNDERKHTGFFMGKSVYLPEKLKEEKNCVVMIASFDFAGEMKRQLEMMKLHEGVKITYYIDLGETL